MDNRNKNVLGFGATHILKVWRYLQSIVLKCFIAFWKRQKAKTQLDNLITRHQIDTAHAAQIRQSLYKFPVGKVLFHKYFSLAVSTRTTYKQNNQLPVV